MIPSYENFIDDINFINKEEYIENISIEAKENILMFNDLYKLIEEEEKKKYTSNNLKFKKFNNDKNNSKFSKINRDLEKTEPVKKILSFDKINNEDDKLNILINSYLNKISDDTFLKISNELIKELLNIKNIKIFEILSEQITNKCILDFKYRNLYIALCSKIWNNNDIHFNLTFIENRNNSYYWNILNDEQNINGPYENEYYMKNIILKKINFKKYFLNYLSKLYKNKEINIQNLNDEDFFEKKKKLTSLVELITILYSEKYINIDIINLIIIDLLHLNNNFKIIEEIEFELLNFILKNILKFKDNFRLNNYLSVFKEFIDTLKEILEIEEYVNKKRCKFFIEDNINTLNKILKNNNEKKINKNVFKYENFEEALNKKNILNIVKVFNKINNDDKFKSVSKIFDKLLEKNKNTDLDFNLKVIQTLFDNNNQIINDVIVGIINNLEDIILDIPNIFENMIELLQELNLYKKYKDTIQSKKDNLTDYSSDES